MLYNLQWLCYYCLTDSRERAKDEINLTKKALHLFFWRFSPFSNCEFDVYTT